MPVRALFISEDIMSENLNDEEITKLEESIKHAEGCGCSVCTNPQSRWKSWAVWCSAIGAIWIILSALGLPAKWGITDETFKTVLDAVGVILTGFGILNNPTDAGNF
jgi:uncharacterized membrane protein